MNDFMVENGVILPRESDGNYFGGSTEEGIYECDYCGGLKEDGETSEIDGMCENCYYAAIKAIQQVLESQEDETLLTVFNHLTEV